MRGADAPGQYDVGMNLRPQTQYAVNGKDSIAFQVLGDGPMDIVYFSGSASHVDMRWEHPNLARMMERLAGLGRLISFDRRGTGCSDPVDLHNLPSWEEWTSDLRVVLDAAGSERAAIFAILDAGQMAMMFAASAPERVSALVLLNTAARLAWAEDNPAGFQPDELSALVDAYAAVWGTPDMADLLYPSKAHDEAFRQWYAKFLRAAAPPSTVKAFLHESLTADIRDALPLIQAPTLVLHSTDFAAVPLGLGRDIVERIPNARLVELQTSAGTLLGGGAATEHALKAIETFLAGTSGKPVLHRSLATVLFTDIVGSTEHAARLGDSAWRELLEEHRWLVRNEVEKHDGREVKTTGDGFLLLFEGPGRAARCACTISRLVRGTGLEIRAGLHVGECQVSDGDVEGIAVHVAARAMEKAQAGEVLATSTVRDLVTGSSLRFEGRGRHALKGLPGSWPLYLVTE
jgi:class 3 adenylate cyclase